MIISPSTNFLDNQYKNLQTDKAFSSFTNATFRAAKPFKESFKGYPLLKLNTSSSNEELTPLDIKMQNVLSRIQVADVSPNHHSAITTLKKAMQQGIISTRNPVTILHFDTHSDLKRNKEPVLHIGNWLNTAIEMGVVKEIYWVLPDWTKEDQWQNTFWKKPGFLTKNDNAFANLMLDPPAEKTFYLEPETRKIHFDKPFDYQTRAHCYKPIKFHKITIDDLPSMPDKNNIMLDICGDYFINSGLSTANNANNISTYKENSAEIDSSINEMFTQLEHKSIRPVLYTAAESKGFVPEEHLNKVSTYLNQIKHNSSKQKRLNIAI